MATAQRGSVSIILSGAFSSAAVSLLAVSLAKRQIANQALALASSTVAPFSGGLPTRGQFGLCRDNTELNRSGRISPRAQFQHFTSAPPGGNYCGGSPNSMPTDMKLNKSWRASRRLPAWQGVYFLEFGTVGAPHLSVSPLGDVLSTRHVIT
jgi:hypothetical protein